MFLINGTIVKADQNGRVYFMSDWCRVVDLEDQGYLTHKFYHLLYGHTDYYITPKTKSFECPNSTYFYGM